MEHTPPQPYGELRYTEEQVDARITEMAHDVISRYSAGDVMFVTLLNGGVPFASKLMFAIQHLDPNFHPNLQYMTVSRYGENREPGPPRLVMDLPPEYRDVRDRVIVLLDDIIDGGLTLQFCQGLMHERGAVAVDIMALLMKEKEGQAQLSGNVSYGFTMPDAWVEGMGSNTYASPAFPESYRWFGGVAIA